MPSPKPNFVLVPASFSAYAIYTPIISLLRAHNFTALAIQLPSTGVVERLVAEETEGVVGAHSYGGSVVAEALGGLGVVEGDLGGVARLVYLSAVAPRGGESQVKAMRLQEGMLPAEVVSFACSFPVFVVGCALGELAYQNALQFPHHSAVSFHSEVTQASYKDDLVINPETQQRFIDTIEEVSGNKVDVKRIDAPHCPNFSTPEELFELLVQAAGM
ncbi:hypothetical protein EJ07DRAFT_165209 [Lizonia empirigonia]|nr:hypothetical protein EJ07DRAFT_165209 [Lizonia empirigonia]